MWHSFLLYKRKSPHCMWRCSSEDGGTHIFQNNSKRTNLHSHHNSPFVSRLERCLLEHLGLIVAGLCECDWFCVDIAWKLIQMYPLDMPSRRLKKKISALKSNKRICIFLVMATLMVMAIICVMLDCVYFGVGYSCSCLFDRYLLCTNNVRLYFRMNRVKMGFIVSTASHTELVLCFFFSFVNVLHFELLSIRFMHALIHLI